MDELNNDKLKRGGDQFTDEPIALSDLMSTVAPYALDDEKFKAKRKPKPRRFNLRLLLIVLILCVGILGAGLFLTNRTIDTKPNRNPLMGKNMISVWGNPDVALIYDKVPVYTKPDLNSQVIEYLPKGSLRNWLIQIVDEKAYAGRWFYVKPGYGWIYETPPDLFLGGDSNEWFDTRTRQLTDAIQQDENNAENYFGRGWDYFAKKDYQSAVEYLTQAITLKPDDIDLYYYRGQIYYAMKDYNKAFNDFDQSILQGDLSSAAYSRRAQASAKLKLWDAALADLKKAIQLNPGYGLLYNDLGLIYNQQGNTTEAQTYFDRALEIDPRLTPAYINRANLARDNGDAQQTALADYNLALTIDGVDEDTLLNRGIYYTLHNQFDLALADYNYALKLNPDDALAYTNRGLSNMKAGKSGEALNDLLKSVSLDPNLDAAQYNLGYFYYYSEDFQKAMDAFEEVDKTNPAFPNLQDMLSKTQRMLD